MSDKYKDSDHFKARCWENATHYLDALNKSEITRLIEYTIMKKYGNTEEPQATRSPGE
jgi:hypothetical protein